jgi:hypothetical protein
MSKNKTTEQFVQEARLVHGDKYDYSKSDYKGKDIKVVIICPVHGDFTQRPHNHLQGQGCPKCSGHYMDTEYFKEKASKVHKGKYIYNLVEYVNNEQKVKIICPIHGEFLQTPHEHLSGCGCRKCKSDVYKNKEKGFNNDLYFESESESYKIWMGIIKRCGDVKHPTYIDCKICEEWKVYSNFKKWFDKRHIEGFHLDKDILVKGNKVYSPNTCCFVPREINNLFIKCQNTRGEYPIGVKKCTNRKGFSATIYKGKKEYVGYFSTPIDAFNAYKEAKENWIKQVADKWKDKLDPKVYQALYNYQVEITD